MAVKVEPYDFHKCHWCGADVLLVAYWDDKAGKVGNVLVNSTFDYPFTKRDFKDRLVCHDFQKAMLERHELTCPNFPKGPAPGEEDNDEPKAYQGPRSKR